MVVGKLVETAARRLRTELEKVGVARRRLRGDDFARGCADYIARFGPLRATAQYQPPPGLRWDDDTYQGDAYGTYAWAVYVAEVSVDTATWETRVDDFVAVQEVGKVINPVLAAGQIEGGVAQAIGWALYEQVVWREGRMANGADDELHHADVDGPARRSASFSKSSRTRTGRLARRASASCRWTGRRRQSSTRSHTRPAPTARDSR